MRVSTWISLQTPSTNHIALQREQIEPPVIHASSVARRQNILEKLTGQLPLQTIGPCDHVGGGISFSDWWTFPELQSSPLLPSRLHNLLYASFPGASPCAIISKLPEHRWCQSHRSDCRIGHLQGCHPSSHQNSTPSRWQLAQ